MGTISLFFLSQDEMIRNCGQNCLNTDWIVFTPYPDKKEARNYNQR